MLKRYSPAAVVLGHESMPCSLIVKKFGESTIRHVAVKLSLLYSAVPAVP
jgi:hypothetical protein